MPLPWEIVTFDVGGANLVLAFQRAGKAEPILVGAITQAAAGNFRSSVRKQLMVVPLISRRVTATIAAQVETMFAFGARVPCAGKVFNNGLATIPCWAKVTSEMQSSSDLWVLNITLTQAA